MDPGIVCIIVACLPFVVALLWFIATYNRLVNLRNLIAESWSDIDTELKRRYDLIPNLVNTVKGYAAHERAVLEETTRARAQAVASTGSPDAQARDENALILSLRHLLAVAESYPQLKADGNFLALQKELVNTEDRLQAARRFFNANTREFNVLRQSFPSNLVAQAGGFHEKQFFQIEDLHEREPVAVDLGQAKVRSSPEAGQAGEDA